MLVVLGFVWPVFVYGHIIYAVRIDYGERTLHYIRKCHFSPPPGNTPKKKNLECLKSKICIKFKHSPYIVEFELPFNILASLFIYAIPIFGIIFWYAKVPMFLWRRNNGASSLNSTVSTNANIKRFEQGKLLQLHISDQIQLDELYHKTCNDHRRYSRRCLHYLLDPVLGGNLCALLHQNPNEQTE